MLRVVRIIFVVVVSSWVFVYWFLLVRTVSVRASIGAREFNYPGGAARRPRVYGSGSVGSQTIIMRMLSHKLVLSE